jgi:hypothetical protein
VYVDNDPVVLLHARSLLNSKPEGACAYIDADLREPEKILHEAAGLLDFSKPVALMLLGILQLIPDEDEPYGVVATLMANLASGSYLVISHPAGDIDPRTVEAAAMLNTVSAHKRTMRSYAEVAMFFACSELIPPGLVQVNKWRPDSDMHAHATIARYAGVSRKR